MIKPEEICSSCGAILKPGASFCVKCGQAIPVEVPEPPSQSIPEIPPVPPAPPVLPPFPPLVKPDNPPGFQQSTPAASITPPPPFPSTEAVPTPPPLKAQTFVPPPPVPPPSFPVQPDVSVQPGNPPQTPATPGSEMVLHVIGTVSRKTGLFSALIYHMVLTNQRLIFALQTKEMQKQDVIDARNAAKQQGKGFLGQVGAQMSTRSGQKYLSCSADMILAENPQNFEIPLNQLKVIETYNGNFDDNEPDTMIVKTFSDKITFVISSAHSVRQELKHFLGNMVK